MRVLTGLLLSLLSVGSAAAEPLGLYCRDGGSHFLMARAAGAGGLEIRISSWQGMHFCGASGLAQNSGAGWLFVEEGCRVSVRPDGEAFRIGAEPEEACAALCGARARLDGLSFPASTRKKKSLDPALFSAGLGEIDPCN